MLVFHIFAAVAEFHRELIRENTKHGLDAARKRGKRLGRPPIMDTITALEAQRYLQQEGVTMEHVAERFDVSVSTLSRHLRSVDLAMAV